MVSIQLVLTANKASQESLDKVSQLSHCPFLIDLWAYLCVAVLLISLIQESDAVVNDAISRQVVPDCIGYLATQEPVSERTNK